MNPNYDRFEAILSQLEVMPIAWDRSCVPEDPRPDQNYTVPACFSVIPSLRRCSLSLYFGSRSVVWSIYYSPEKGSSLYAEGWLAPSGDMIIRRSLSSGVPHCYSVSPPDKLGGVPAVYDFPPVLYEPAFIAYA